MAEHIPQLIWALIKAMRHFYSTVYTKEDLDPAGGDLPRLPTASLDAYTFLLKAKLPIEVDSILEQWLPAHKQPTLTPAAAAHKPATQTDNQTRQQTQNPFNPSSTTGSTIHTYQNQPTMFANNKILCKLRNK